jgi:hypothetical protein
MAAQRSSSLRVGGAWHGLDGLWQRLRLLLAPPRPPQIIDVSNSVNDFQCKSVNHLNAAIHAFTAAVVEGYGRWISEDGIRVAAVTYTGELLPAPFVPRCAAWPACPFFCPIGSQRRSPRLCPPPPPSITPYPHSPIRLTTPRLFFLDTQSAHPQHTPIFGSHY